MIAPEQRLLSDMAERARLVAAGLDEALQLVGQVPRSLPEFVGLGLIERTAATALLKRVEQMVDLLVRMFRTSLGALGTDTTDLYVRDLANKMEKAGVLDDAGAWVAMVRLRNRLAHEYPVSPTEQMARLHEAVAARALLILTSERMLAFLLSQQLLPTDGAG